MSYQIKMVSEMLGIPKNTLIAWERRYTIVEPQRTAAGYREYTDADLSRLRRVQALLDQGYKVGEACRIVLDENVHLLREEQAAQVRMQPGRVPANRADLAGVKDQLKTRLLAFDRDGADKVVARLVLVPFEQAIDEVYFPLLREIGQEWEIGRVTVVQEHYTTAFCREKLLVMLNSTQVGLIGSPEITCATPPGEHHELGLLGLALRLAIRGFRITYLGVNVPTLELIDHVNTRRPAALCMSVVHSRPRGEMLAYARALREQVAPSVRVAIGGRATDDQELEVEGVSFVGHGLPAWLQDPHQLSRVREG